VARLTCCRRSCVGFEPAAHTRCCFRPALSPFSSGSACRSSFFFPGLSRCSLPPPASLVVLSLLVRTAFPPSRRDAGFSGPVAHDFSVRLPPYTTPYRASLAFANLLCASFLWPACALLWFILLLMFCLFELLITLRASAPQACCVSIPAPATLRFFLAWSMPLARSNRSFALVPSLFWFVSIGLLRWSLSWFLRWQSLLLFHSFFFPLRRRRAVPWLKLVWAASRFRVSGLVQ